jgi:hypothetical protein
MFAVAVVSAFVSACVSGFEAVGDTSSVGRGFCRPNMACCRCGPSSAEGFHHLELAATLNRNQKQHVTGHHQYSTRLAMSQFVPGDEDDEEETSLTAENMDGS